MKIFYSGAIFVLAMGLAGCTTSSKVQEMIDTSHRDYTDRLDVHETSIDVLKKSAMTSLEKSKENGALLVELQATVTQAEARIKTIKGYAEASKVLSAANTVKVADLENEMNTNQEQLDATTKKLAEIDKLYEKVLIGHYQVILDSATKAIESLEMEGWSASTNAPVMIDEPIEIIAPDTSVEVAATNVAAVE